MKIPDAIALPRFRDFHRTSVDEFVASIARRVPPGGMIIDAGAGEGMYRNLFAHARYVALDYGVGDPAWDYTGLDVVCDLHALPLKCGCVSFILCTQTLEHLHSPRSAMAEIGRALAPGGEVFCTLPFLGDAHHQEPFDFYRYTRHGVEHLFRSAGFTEVDVQPFGGYNTLLVSYLQKGVGRVVEKCMKRPAPIRWGVMLVRLFLLLILRWGGRFAWSRDRRDPLRYRYAMGFSVTAKK